MWLENTRYASWLLKMGAENVRWIIIWNTRAVRILIELQKVDRKDTVHAKFNKKRNVLLKLCTSTEKCIVCRNELYGEVKAYHFFLNYPAGAVQRLIENFHVHSPFLHFSYVSSFSVFTVYVMPRDRYYVDLSVPAKSA